MRRQPLRVVLALALAATATATVTVTADDSEATALRRGRRPGAIKVIGAGLGRTGTDSLRIALTKLGYKPYHMFENIKGGHSAEWNAVAARAPGAVGVIVDKVLLGNGFDATTDFPACLLYAELAARFPAGKVVLSVRSSPEVWAESIRATIGRLGHIFSKMPFRMLSSTRLAVPAGQADAYLWGELGVTRDADGELPGLEDAYTRWIEKVKATVPTGRLLVHNAADGWEPLCSFLEVDPESCPTEPYPRSNARIGLGTLVAVLGWIADFWIPGCGLLGWLVVGCCRRVAKTRPKAD